MKYNTAKGSWINLMLKKKVFQEGDMVGVEELKDVTGLDIRELTLCWIFEHRNNFKAMIAEWKKGGARMSYQEIQGY